MNKIVQDLKVEIKLIEKKKRKKERKTTEGDLKRKSLGT